MKNLINTIALSLLVLNLMACGGNSDPQVDANNSLSAKSTSDSQGQFLLPLSEEVLTGNLLVNISVSDLDSLKSVYIIFNQGTTRHVLCTSENSCSGKSHNASYSGIYPGDYGVSPGVLTLGLWVVDQTDTQQLVDSIMVNWQPQQISGLQYTRSTSGQSIELNWNVNPQLLRYNVYIAAESGVNQKNYAQLNEGQALLALADNTASFDNLIPSQTYFVLLAGVDGSGESTFVQELTIAPNSNMPNSPPQAQDDSETILEDTQSTFSPLDNDSDPDGDVITLVSAVASSGQVTLSTQTLNFLPLTNFNGQVVIDYVIRDPAGLIDSAQILVQVSPVNDPPIVVDESVSTLENTPINIDVLANDSDPDGDTLLVSLATAQNGSVNIENDQSLTYSPDNAFSGQDSISYEVSDGNGGNTTGIVEIIVSSGNLAPEASDDSYKIYQNSGNFFDKSSGLLNNDGDPNGDVITVSTTPVLPPNSGTLTLGTDGSFTYIPVTDFVGVVTFTYEISDPFGLTASADVTIDVQAVPANLLGDSLNITGQFLYIGIGETAPGNGIGSGLYRIGNCLQIIDTECSMFGEYVESAGSGNEPGESGTYTFVMTYSGVDDSPVIARSVTAGSNSLTFTNVGDALFELKLFPSSGGVIKASYPEPGYAKLTNFGAFITNSQVCQGLPANQTCSIANVGLTADARDTAPLDRLNFIISGYATVDLNGEPVAVDDQYQLNSGQSLQVNAPGVLDNDNDFDIPVVGDNLSVKLQIATTLSQPIALAVDEYRQRLYVYSGFSNNVSVLDRSGQVFDSLLWPGEGANDADMDVAPEALSLANVAVPQGSLLIFNGETAETEIYAINPDTNVTIAQLNTQFGISHVVGGAYNPRTKTFFLLQDNVPGPGVGNQVAEIDPNTGQVLSSFLLNSPSNIFNVSYGDLDVNNVTGNLYLVSSISNEIVEVKTNGQLVRRIALPTGANSVSGMALNADGDRLWFVNNSASSPVLEAEFINQGQLPGMIATVISPVQHGTLTLNLDGSFVYQPDNGFVGQDQFIYQVSDQAGKIAQAKVILTVQ
jgi:hypothetical protein